MDGEKKDKRIAVLIDADNVSEKYIRFIFDEISNHGTPTYKRIYGDWTKPNLSSWKTDLLNYSITPIQQYSYTTGKNSTDSALIIDAMDILYSKNVDGFCIVSSDSDFTRLAARLRETGMYVLGMGEKKTPSPFIAACEKFKYLDVLAAVTQQQQQPQSRNENKNEVKKEVNNGVMATKDEITVAIRTIITEISDDDGWANLGEVGNQLSKRFPDFDTRNYGYSKLTPFMCSLKVFEVQSRRTNTPRITHKFVRIKE
ncbi:MAG: NYN domain-containing protein [Eubacteriales bacterium]